MKSFLFVSLILSLTSAFVPMKVIRGNNFALGADGPPAVKKADFVAAVSEKTGLTKIDSEAALAAVIDTITEEVSRGRKISMLGFGTFKLSERKERMGRNPKTGEAILIKASKTPSFSASKTFKEKCNQ
ncbi:hypothetical protein TrCOL_g3056 [Triparma columacea]|uniref:Uncharacterized protein n=1 Tax=Triparma columacea TaxID=722753 RepID=A0A9W7LDR6_9STRA|nr:hypothetical protein TrCOL_g3056 [Triparma columacea]